MMDAETVATGLQFLTGRGEMSILTREKNWEETTVGHPSQWPQSLKTTLGIILNSKFPMFLWWGPELTCFYNDAYRPSLGQNGKHPDILGMPAAEAWPEIWDIIKPLIDQVLAGGEATWSEDQLIPIYRNGKLEDVYWTFSYSPVVDESGKVAGVLVTCSETTEKIYTVKKLEDSNRRYLDNIMQAPVAMCIFRGADHVVEIANRLMLEIWGKQAEDVMNKPIFEGLPEAKGQGLEVLLENVYKTGVRFEANERPVDLPRKGGLETTFINFVYEALKEPDGSISGIVAIALDVTEQVRARSQLEVREHRVRALVKNTPFPMAVYVGREMRIEMANQSIINIWGKGEDVIGKTFTEVLPELSSQLVFEQIKDVFNTGQSFHTFNTPLDLVVDGLMRTYYFNYSFTPLYDEAGNVYGVMNTGADVTDLNVAKKQIEESDKRFRNTVKQAPLGITILRGPQFVVEMANEAYLQLVDRKEEEFVGKALFAALPEAQDIIEPFLTGVLTGGTAFHAADLSVTLNRYGRQELGYFNLVYHPLKEESGEVSGIMAVAAEVTEAVKAKHSLAESERRFRNLVTQSPIPMTILRGKEYEIEIANEAMLKRWGRAKEEVIGKKIFEALPEANAGKFSKLLEHVFITGDTYKENEAEVLLASGPNGEMVRSVVDFEYAPLFEDEKVSGIMVTVSDVTEKVDARRKVESAEERLRLATEAAELATWDLDLRTRDIIHSPRLAEIFGHPKEAAITHAKMREQIHPEDIHRVVEKAFDLALQTGLYWYEARVLRPDKSLAWIRTQGKVVYNEERKPVKMIGTLRDITEEKYHQQELQESEQKFRLLADSMPQHIWTADPQGTLNYYNKSVYEYSGLSAEQLLKGGWLQIVHPEDREENIRQWMEAVQTGKDFLFEHRFRRYDGEYRWQLSRAIPQKDSAGNIQMWVGTSTDIQEQKTFAQDLEKQVNERTKELKALNDALKTSEERYHLMVEEVQDYAILYLSKEGIVENWNKGAEKIKGYTAEEIVGKSISTFYTQQDIDADLPHEMLKQARDTGRALQEGWRVRKDGTPLWASVVITAVHDADDNVIGFSKVTHDLTEKKAAEDRLKINAEQLEQKNRELVKINTELQSFAYVSSHDLQEPLRKIQTFATRILEREEKNLSEQGKDYFNRMQLAAKRMQTLIEDLLAYSRTNSSDRVYKKVHVKDIVQEVKNDFRELLAEKHAIIETDDLCELHVIHFQFRQLIHNLVGNSIKFSHPGKTPHIKFSCKFAEGREFDITRLDQDKKYCRLSMEDNGIGFEQEYSERIFEVFQRLHGKDEYKGTGIGLAIVKKIVENHHGIIIATGIPDVGARFDIYIPCE